MLPSNGVPSDAPGPRYRTPFGLLDTIRRDPLRLLLAAFREYGDVVRCRCAPGDRGPFNFYLLWRPEHVEHVLRDNHKNYWKGLGLQRLAPFFGRGLFLNEGEPWRRQRRLAQPAFHRQRIEGLVSLMTDSIAAMLDGWQPAATRGDAIDMAAEMAPLTTAIVWKAMVGRDFPTERAELIQSQVVMNAFGFERLLTYVPAPLWWPSRRNRAFQRALGVIEGLVYRTIAERRRASHPGDDLLGMFLAATDPDGGEAMSDRQLRDELLTVLGAGQETTAILLAWSWWLLVEHPEIEARLRHEVEHALAGRVPTAADVPALAYVRMFVQEALRLYPPAWGITRQSIAEDEIGGYRIRAGAPVSLGTYFTHRHPELWPDPETFDPERFTPAAVDARPRFAFFPFGGGPRVCIGLEFALLEATLTIAMVCQRYRFRPVPGRPVEPWIQIALRPRNGVWMTLATPTVATRPPRDPPRRHHLGAGE